MTALDALWWGVLAFLSAQAATLGVNVIAFPTLRPARRSPRRSPRRSSRRPSRHPSRRPRGTAPLRVSLLVPARNEAATLPGTLPALLAQGADEVIVLDDASTDATASVIEAARALPGGERLRLLAGAPLPLGWSGKNWACHQLAAAAQGDVLIFTDADVTWYPEALAAVTEAMQAEDADLFTLWPRQRCVTLGERALVPLVDLLLLANLPHPLVRALPFASLAAGNGQLMAWRRSAYAAVGGHAAVAREVLEDVRMAQRAKRARLRLTLRLGGALVVTRMYRSGGEAVAGFAKNVLAAAGGAPAALLAIWIANVAAYALPWLLAWSDARWWPLALAGVALRSVSDLKSGRGPQDALLQPFAPVALTPVIARALARRGGYVWKGRSYP
jgi:hypothetical protein